MAARPNPSKIVSIMSDQGNPDRLFFLDRIEPFSLIDDWIAGSPDAKLPPSFVDGGIQKTYAQQRQIIESLAARLEDIYLNFQDADPNFLPSSLFNETVVGAEQSNWKTTLQRDGRFKGRYVAQDKCAFHLPSTKSEDKFRVDLDVLHIKEACALLKDNEVKYRDTGLTFQYASSVSGVTMDYPASLRGLSFDNRFENWFKRAMLPPKDVVIVVDHSGSSQPGTPCGAMNVAEAQVRSILTSFVTDNDRVQLILIGETPHTSPCFENRLVPGKSENVDKLLEWFDSESRKRGGPGRLGSGVMEALSILQMAQNSNESTGGARFVMVITDGIEVEDILEKGFKRFTTEAFREGAATDPVKDVHVVGVALTKSGQDVQKRTSLDAAACSQHGLVWKLMLPPDGIDKQKCFRKKVNISVDDGTDTFEVEPVFLLNASGLISLAALPFGSPPEKGGISSLYWQDLRRDIKLANDSTYRRVLSVSKPFFDRKSDPPKAAGVVHADFLFDDFVHALRSIDVPALTHLFIVKHEDGVGHVIAHSTSPPDFSDFIAGQEKQGDYGSSILDFCGASFESDGVLAEMVRQEQGSKTVQQKVVVDHDWSPSRDLNMQHVVREAVRTVTYFWKRIPKTSFTVLLSIGGSPTRESGTEMLSPNLKSPEPCPPGVSTLNRSGILPDTATCWDSTYRSFPSVYHRMDLMSSNPKMPARFSSPFGGESACGSSWCTYDTSTWVGSPSAFISEKRYLQENPTYSLLDAINSDLLNGSTAKRMLGGGLRHRALNALRITSNMEAYWKDVLGVSGIEANGNPKTLEDGKIAIRRDIMHLFFVSETGIQRIYPGRMLAIDDDYNVKREPCYSRAVSHPGEMTVSQPYLPTNLNTSIWTISMCKAVYYSPGSSHEHVKSHEFGVAGVHYRFDAFVRFFREATTLRAWRKFGCGDMGTSDLADRGLACFLLNENAHVLLDRKIMNLVNDHTSTLDFDPSMRNLHNEEPLLMQQLLDVQAFSKEILDYGSKRHTAYRLNETTMKAFSAQSRGSAKAAGVPGSDLVGIDFLKSVKSFNGVTLNHIWLYQVPNTKTYLLVVKGYTKLNRAYFCGSLSLYCPSVFDPLETTTTASVCELLPSRYYHKMTDYVYRGPTFKQLRSLHKYLAPEGEYELRCPLIFQTWTIAMFVVGGLLFVVVIALLVKVVLRRTRRRLAAKRVSEATVAENSHGAEATRDHVRGDDGHASGAVSAREDKHTGSLWDYKMLVARQWQLAEDLSKRDEGDVHTMTNDLARMGKGIHEVFQQLDYLQQRVQKHEAMGPDSRRLRRGGQALSEFIESMLIQVDDLKAQGRLPGLDPELEESATELRNSLGSQVLPAGTREALFYRINHPHLVERRLRIPGDGSLSASQSMEIERAKSREDDAIRRRLKSKIGDIAYGKHDELGNE